MKPALTADEWAEPYGFERNSAGIDAAPQMPPLLAAERAVLDAAVEWYEDGEDILIGQRLAAAIRAYKEALKS